MSSISAADVKSLRDKTNAPMMHCKAALMESNGDMDKAIEILRTKMKDIQVKRGARETAEGRVAVFIEPDQKTAGMIELRCESAPVAKSEHFVKLANHLAHLVATRNPANVDALLAEKLDGKAVSERITELVGVIGENMKPARFVRKTGGLIGSYEHHDGTVAVLVQVEGAQADPALLRDVCMHIAARNPVAARTEDVAADVIANEKALAQKQLAEDPKNSNKPANIMEKILEGKLKTWLAENVLVEQPFVKDDSKTVGQLLSQSGLKLLGFVRYRVGELS